MTTCSVEDIITASDARLRALEALEAGGTLAEQAESEDFARAVRVSESRAAIAAFNGRVPPDPADDP